MTATAARTADGDGERRHAVVVGAGIAGLLAARVLHGHYDTVTVVDRDHLPDDVGPRPGVPQSHHVHGLQPRGAEILDELFPELRARLADSGATVVRSAERVRIVTREGVLPLDAVTGRETLLASRSLLEWHLRHLVAEQPSTRVLPGTEVVGLEADVAGGRARVRGVRLRRGRTGAEELVAADLVVDASGRRSHLPEWLERLGVGPVDEETVTSAMSYASRIYEPSEDAPRDVDLALVLGRPPHSPRVGLVQRVEGGRWHVSLAGLDGHRAPTDDAGFLEWARGLPDPTVYETIRAVRPVGPIRGWGTPTNRWRHVERVAHWPRGLVALGDAVCALNPSYGQGMSVAALEALVLDRCLADGRRELERRFQRRLARTVADPWAMATSDELEWPSVRLVGGRPSPGLPLVRRYLGALLRAAVADPGLSARYFAVISMRASPRSLLAPRMLARVAVGSGRRRLGR